MLIFNTTYLVSDKVHGAWLKWVHEHHIPFMLDSAYFSMPQVAKVYTHDEQEGTSFSVQFHVENMEKLEQWGKDYAPAFQADTERKFGTEVVYFTTILEIIKGLAQSDF